MTQRNQWEFQYDAHTVARGARSKQDHHTERAEWWHDEAVVAESKLREQGVDFRDMPVSGGSRMEVVVDRQLNDRLAEGGAA